MEIILENNYVITTDAYQFILSKIIPDSKFEGGYKRMELSNGELGGLVKRHSTFHPTLASLKISLKNRELRDDEIEDSANIRTLEQLVLAIEKINKRINDKMDNIWDTVEREGR